MEYDYSDVTHGCCGVTHYFSERDGVTPLGLKPGLRLCDIRATRVLTGVRHTKKVCALLFSTGLVNGDVTPKSFSDCGVTPSTIA